VPVILGQADRTLVVVQALLTFAPYAWLGWRWGPVAGLVCASILLTVRTRVAWWLVSLVITVDAGIGGVLIWKASGDVATVGDVVFRVMADINVCLILFTLTRLAQLTAAAQRTRDQHTALRVAAVHQRFARGLRASVEHRLSTIVAISRRFDAHSPPTRHDLAAISQRANLAATAARSIRQEDPSATPDLTVADPTPGVTMGAARTLAMTVIVTYSTVGVGNLISVADRHPPYAIALTMTAVVVVLQLYHGVPRRDLSPPRRWQATLALQLVAGAVLVLATDAGIASPVVLAIGVLLVRLPPPWSFVLFGVGVTAVAWAPSPYVPDIVARHLYFMSLAIVAGLVVYATSRLPQVSRELSDTRHEVAELAARAEQVRLARDAHDHLGMHLSTIVLKAELVRELLTTNTPRAIHHATDLRNAAERALVELRSLATGTSHLKLTEELDSAVALLEAAGAQVDIKMQFGPCSHTIDEVMAVVAREAATNIVRHATATRCSIDITTDGATYELTITNNGAPPRLDLTEAGSGIRSLSDRVRVVGGSLSTSTRDGGWYALRARIPRPVDARGTTVPVRPDLLIGQTSTKRRRREPAPPVRT
jgi:two-component system, NarL family, sensor histidine kinase DesK